MISFSRDTYSSPIPDRGMASRGEGWLRLTDAQLAERGQALPCGDLEDGDFREVVVRYQPAVDAFCRELLGAGSDAEEACERAFADCHRAFALLPHSEDAVREQLFASALRHCLKLSDKRAA